MNVYVTCPAARKKTANSYFVESDDVQANRGCSVFQLFIISQWCQTIRPACSIPISIVTLLQRIILILVDVRSKDLLTNLRFLILCQIVQGGSWHDSAFLLSFCTRMEDTVVDDVILFQYHFDYLKIILCSLPFLYTFLVGY